MRDVLRPRHRPYGSWTASAGRIEAVPVIEPDERDGMTLEEQEQAAEQYDGFIIQDRSKACSRDLRCYRYEGHEGEHMYGTPPPIAIGEQPYRSPKAGAKPPCSCGHRRKHHRGQPSRGGYGGCWSCDCQRFTEEVGHAE